VAEDTYTSFPSSRRGEPPCAPSCWTRNRPTDLPAAVDLAGAAGGLVGKVDAVADRKASVLRVNAIHEDVRFTRTVGRAVQAELDDLAAWLDLGRCGRRASPAADALSGAAA
jgi:hypothetical protein